MWARNRWEKSMWRMHAAIVTLSVALGASLGDVASACAQNGGPRVSGLFGTALGEGDPAIATGGSVGYRFTPHFGFDLEVLILPSFDPQRFETIFDTSLDQLPPIISGIPIRRPDFESSGHTVAFLTNFVTEFPTGARWLIPYVSGGGGVASVSRSIGPIYYALPSLPTTVSVIDLSGVPITFPDIAAGFEVGPIERSETDLALTVGGGIDFQVWKGLAVGADLRYLHLFGATDDLDLTRIAGRVTYRF